MDYDNYAAQAAQVAPPDDNDDIANAMATPLPEQPVTKSKKKTVKPTEEPASPAQVTNDMTADDLYESQQIEAKIRRLAVEFPELKLEEEPEFAQLTDSILRPCNVCTKNGASVFPICTNHPKLLVYFMWGYLAHWRILFLRL